MNCPSNDNLKQLALGTLDDASIDEIEQHLLSCETCRISLAKIETSLDDPLSKRLHKSKREESFDHVKIDGFRIAQQIGVGGMGTVYEAVDEKNGELRAVKVLHPSRHFDPNTVARFQREKEVIARLKHPAIVKSFPSQGDKRTSLCIVMERLHGMDLGEFVKQHGPLPVDQARDFILQAAHGLHFAHENGIVHRDIKPSNLFVTEFGSIKILDLGLARLSETENETANTLTDQIVGTPDYLSPEQAVSPKSIDRRSDIYSLGCTFFYLLTGKAPFSNEETVGGKIAAHARDQAPNIRKLRSDVSPELATVLNRMLEKKPEKRFQTAAEVAEALTAKPSSRSFKRYGVILGVILLTILCIMSVLFSSKKAASTNDSNAAPATIALTPEPEIVTAEEPVKEEPIQEAIPQKPVYVKSKNNSYRVEGRQILEPSGKPVFLRGFALNSYMETRREDVMEMKEMGVKYARYIFSLNFPWDTSISEQKWEFQRLFSEIDEVLTGKEIDVIVAFEYKIDSRKLPVDQGKRPWNDETVNEHFLSVWKRIIGELKYNPRIIGWHIFSQPDTYDRTRLKQWYKNVIPAIREMDPIRPLLVSGINWAGFEQIGDYMLVDDPNIIYSINVYNYSRFASSSTIENEISKIFHFRDRNNIPVICAQWGYVNYDPANTPRMKELITIFETNDLPWFNHTWVRPESARHSKTSTNKTMTDRYELFRDVFLHPEKYNRNSSEFGK